MPPLTPLPLKSREAASFSQALEPTGAIVYQPSRLKWIAVFALSLGFTIGGYYMLRDDPTFARQFGGYLCCGFFALGTLVSVVNLIPGASFLKLDSEGFTMCSMWRSQRYYWEDISHFGVTSVQAGPTTKTMIGFSFVEGSPRRPESVTVRSLNMRLSGFEAALPDNYGQGYERLASELTRRLTVYREKRSQ